MSVSQSFVNAVGHYARLFGVEVRVQGTVAYTNGKVITIPRIVQSNEKNVRITYAYLAHEAAHIRYTDFTVMKNIIADDYVLHNLFNILEDARIERLIGREFIGVYENIKLLNLDSLPKWGKLIKGLDANQCLSMVYMLLQSVLWYYIHKYDEVRTYIPRLLTVCGRYIDHKTVRDVYGLCKFFATSIDGKDSEYTLDVARAIKKLIAKCSKPRSDKYKQSESCMKMADSPQFKDGEVWSKHGKAMVLAQQFADDGDPCTLKPKTETRIAGMASKDSSSRDDFGMVQADMCVPQGMVHVDINTHVVANKLQRYIRAYVDEMKSHAEQGRRLDPKRLVKLPCGETKFFKSKQIDLEHNTHVSILVDVSSSMLSTDGNKTTRAEEANKCALTLSSALSSIENVTRECIYFPGISSECSYALKKSEALSQQVINRFTQRPRGSTPLAQALWTAIGNMKFSEKERNIIMIITDGMPDSVKNVNKALHYCDKANIDVYALSIRADLVAKDLFKNYVVIEDAQDLIKKSTEYLYQLFNSKQVA